MKTANRTSAAVSSRGYLLAILTGLAFTFAAVPTVRASGITRHGTTGIMFRKAFLMKAGITYSFTTRNLTANADTILHVLKYPDGQFIAGNDDTITLDPDSGQSTLQKFSSVSVAAASTDRNVYLVVRGKPGTPDGSADFRIVGTQGLTTVKDALTRIDFSAGFVQNVPSLAAGTHITTVEETVGTVDTMVLVVGSDPATTLAFDDDDGVDRMSFARVASACSSSCQIIVGTPKPIITIFGLGLSFPAGAMTLIWDETIETSGHDSDRDGLSAELEALLLTNPGSFDSDGDGIGDGFEVYGAVLAGSGRSPPLSGGAKDGNLLKFPKYGANPTGQDIFVEIDWVPACPASDPNCCTGTTCPAGAINVNQRRAQSSELIQAINSMNAAARVHFDAGVPFVAGDTNVRFGDWGGANRLSEGDVEFSRPSGAINYSVTLPDPLIGDKDCFTGVVPARVGFFHHQVITDDKTNGRLPVLGTTLFESAACALVHTNDGSIAHELGHNFNLRHGGFANSADGELNCKMNYGSIMSYPNQFVPNDFAPGYSIGRFLNFTVNGFSMNEAAGLGVPAPGFLSVFDNGAMGRGFSDPALFPSGIDWNMDGRIDSGTVRAPANWASNTCAAPYMRGNWRLMIKGNFQDGASLSSAALPVMTVAEASAASPQIFGVGETPPTTGAVRPQLLVGSGSAAACQQQGLGTCTFWTQREAVDMNFAFKPHSQLAVAGPLIAYRDVVGNLYYVRRGKSITGWVGPGFLGTNITGDPSAVQVNGRVKVYAVDTSGFLRRWEFDEATGAWPISGEADYWEDGTYVKASLGVGLAHGVIRPGGQGVFAAIPNRDKANTANQVPIEFARHSSTTFTQTITVPAHTIPKFNFQVPSYTYTTTVKQDRWQRIPTAIGPFASFAKPGLVYAPFDVSVPDDGRFYMTWVQGGTGFQSTTAFIRFTEGNDQSAGVKNRRLLWKAGQLTSFADPDNQSRDLRRGVGLSRFGTSVAGVANDFFGSNYFPAADGIVNANLHDFEDNLLVRHNLPCSVHGQSCDESP